MSKHKVKIKSIANVTHDVLRIRTEKPQDYSFTPGQATDVSVNKPGWENELRPFTFTSLPGDDYLEFTIKSYSSHNGVTHELTKLQEHDSLFVGDVFGAIAYKGEGVFVAGGAGVTPFISIFRHLRSKNEIRNNKLIFANKTKADIILEQEFHDLLNKNFVNILSDEEVAGYAHGFITGEFLKVNVTDFNQNFYLCGPPPMMDAVEHLLADFGVDEKRIVQEAF
jgi:ferredoxin-NADP reductase